MLNHTSDQTRPDRKGLEVNCPFWFGETSLSGVIQLTRIKVKDMNKHVYFSFLKFSLFYFFIYLFSFPCLLFFYYSCGLCLGVLFTCFCNTHSCCSLFTQFTTLMQMNGMCHFRIKKQKTLEKNVQSVSAQKKKKGKIS